MIIFTCLKGYNNKTNTLKLKNSVIFLIETSCKFCCKINESLNNHFRFVNDGFELIDTIGTILRRFRKYENNGNDMLLLASFLAVRIV